MSKTRILAIDLRSKLFGFAVLEGPETLLDFGRKLVCIDGERNSAKIARKRIVALLDCFLPSVIVIKHTSGRRDLKPPSNRGVFATIKREAESRSLEFVLFKRRDIHQAFQGSGYPNKDDIAAFVGGWFPEVEWKLPPRRKNWQPEHHTMPMFDAISVGLAYFAQRGDVLPANAMEARGTPG